MTAGKTIKPVMRPVLPEEGTTPVPLSPEGKAKRAAVVKQAGSVVALALERLAALRASVDRYRSAAEGFDREFVRNIAGLRQVVDGLARQLKQSATGKAALEQKIGAHPALADRCQVMREPHRLLVRTFHEFESEQSRIGDVPGRFPILAASFAKLAAIPELKDRRTGIGRVAADLGKLAKLGQALVGAQSASAYRAKFGGESGFVTPKTTVREIVSGALGGRYAELAKFHQSAAGRAEGILKSMAVLFDRIALQAPRLFR
jgi:hypothetical protein